MTRTSDDGNPAIVPEPQERLAGASVWQQELFDALIAHERDESAVISSYAKFAEESPSATVRFLVNLIVEDEHRHHRLLAELANTVRLAATLEERGPTVPFLDVRRNDQELLEATKKFLAVERNDRDELKRLSRLVHDVGGPLEAFVVDMLRSDTERHIRMLRFVSHLIRHSPLR